jgi:hypothetical protein
MIVNISLIFEPGQVLFKNKKLPDQVVSITKLLSYICKIKKRVFFN